MRQQFALPWKRADQWCAAYYALFGATVARAWRLFLAGGGLEGVVLTTG